ncbi:oxygenase MpaB family protein [Actinomadura sp. WAC 06369]|uniref:oxygenase MpaB family protein n=1 Tax=Actinomadura sp. WAC 06369 TaxID=2203193 RepID=UPI001F2DCDBD|nr:oxygenase MpaB family protein [Actinomadura sp. WAC 06369]
MTDLDVRPITAGAIPGPDSLTWRYAGDWRGALTGRATLLLQVAHPVVGAGVGQHSGFLEDRWGRLARTLESTFDFLGYRGERRGRREAARLREVHKDIKGVDDRGRRYHALNPEAYLWVHATLFHGMVQTQRLFGRGVPAAREEALFGEWRDLALALGITERHLPAGPAAFREYFDAMVEDRLECNDTVRLLIDLDRTPLPPPAALAASGPGLVRARAADGRRAAPGRHRRPAAGPARAVRAALVGRRRAPVPRLRRRPADRRPRDGRAAALLADRLPRPAARPPAPVGSSAG